MPRFRKSFKKTPKRRGFFNTAGSILKTAQSALRTAKFVKSLINVEFKTKDTTDTQTFTGSNVPYVIHLSGIAQGDDSDDRNGDSIKAKGLTVKGALINNGSIADKVRVMVIRDKHCDGANPVITEVLQTSSYLGFRNTDFTARYHILMDKLITLGSHPDNGADWKNFNEHFDLNYHIKYKGTTGVVASQGNGGLFLLLFGTVSSDFSTYVINTRLRYIDN